MVEKGVAMKCFSRGTRGEAGVLSGEAGFAGFEVEEGWRRVDGGVLLFILESPISISPLIRSLFLGVLPCSKSDSPSSAQKVILQPYPNKR